MKELLSLLEMIPHSGQTISAELRPSFASLEHLKGPILRSNVNDIPLHKKGFDEECFRCRLDKLIEDVKV